MKYNVNDEYGYLSEYSYLNKVIKYTLQEENVKKAIFSITFVGKERIQEINKTYRGIDKVTDVISFAFEDEDRVLKKSLRVLGDIFICIPRMKEQAVSYGHSEKRELSFLTVHGLLHLLGYDHQTKEEEEKMFSKQELILNAADIKR